ncbi:MAG: ATP-binding cassette domain-containing protein [Oligoflexia bacterium]|nr:ATP-binding cassette domain-containing protein [Oligoflexia bacterium]
MIQVSGLSKTYGDQVLFDGAAFVLNHGERLGLVGRNGSGKSTLFKLILDEEHPDSGSITAPRGYRIGRLSQHLSFTEKTVLDEACLGLPPDERDQSYRAEIILGGLGFSADDMLRAPAEFSGGFQIRINLARLLLSEPNLLLLDEPTNYLDIVSARWLAQALRSWRDELIIITHDRSFMDSVTTHTMLIYRSTFRKIAGPTQKLFDAIEVDEEVYEKTRLNEDKKRREMEQFINRFRAKASKAALVQSRVKALEKMAVREELSEDATLDFVFAYKQFHGKHVLNARELSFGYDLVQPLVQNLSLDIGKRDRIGIIGKNGRGKSTLLRLLAQEIKPQHGEIALNQNTAVGYFGQTNIDRLTSSRTVEEEISHAHPGMHRTKVRGICGTLMFDGDKALKKISVLSGGEKSRVLLGKIIATPSNLLLLDEPTNHLDMDSVEALKSALEEYDGAVVLVTHNEMLLRDLCTRLIVFQGSMPFVLETGYDEFLKKIGWEDEESATPTRTPEKTVPATARVNPSKEQRSLKKTIAKLEAGIMALEAKEKELHAKLAKLLEDGPSSEVQATSMALHEVTKKIDKNFEDLSNVSNALEKLDKA